MDGIIAHDRVLPCAGYSPELKLALEELRRELGLSARRKKGPLTGGAGAGTPHGVR